MEEALLRPFGFRLAVLGHEKLWRGISSVKIA